MSAVKRHKQFLKDFAKISISDNYFAKLVQYIALLLQEAPLPPEAHDHSLEGKWGQYREFHIGVVTSNFKCYHRIVKTEMTSAARCKMSLFGWVFFASLRSIMGNNGKNNIEGHPHSSPFSILHQRTVADRRFSQHRAVLAGMDRPDSLADIS